MCSFISTDCGCSGSSSTGVSVQSIAVVVSLTAAVSLTYQVFALAPYFFLFGLYPAVVLVATRRGRKILRWLFKAVTAGVVGGAALARWWVRRRHAAAPTSTDVAAAAVRAWSVTVYEPTGRTNRVLTRGVVEGEWATPMEVEAETVARAIAAFGYDNAGTLRAHAQLVAR